MMAWCDHHVAGPLTPPPPPPVCTNHSHPPSHFTEKYGVDECKYVDELDTHFMAAELAVGEIILSFCWHSLIVSVDSLLKGERVAAE